MKYRIYEGTPESRDDTISFTTKKEAIRYCRSQIDYRNASQENWITHVTLPKTGQIIETFCTVKYYDALDAITREQVAKRKFKAAIEQANAIFQENKELWLLCASAEDNAIDTAIEKGFKSDAEGTFPEYFQVCVGSLESLLSDSIPEHDPLRTFFASFNIVP